MNSLKLIPLAVVLTGIFSSPVLAQWGHPSFNNYSRERQNHMRQQGYRQGGGDYFGTPYQSPRQQQNYYYQRNYWYSLHPMLNISNMKLLILIPLVALFSSLNADPVSAQWNDYNSNRQLQLRPHGGWSSGDQFNNHLMRERSPRPYNYQPGLQHNIRYRQNDCALYVNCW